MRILAHAPRGLAALHAKAERYLQTQAAIAERLVRRAAQELATELSEQSTPRGFGEAARQRGRGAVSRDIHRAITTPSAIYRLLKDEKSGAAGAFWAAIQAGDPAAATRALASSRFGSSRLVEASAFRNIHEAARDATGRVSAASQKYIAISSSSLDAYVRERSAAVGAAKDGWADAAEKAGRASSIPAWARSTPADRGSADIARSSRKIVITLRNNVRYAGTALPPAALGMAINKAAQRLQERLTTALRSPSARW